MKNSREKLESLAKKHPESFFGMLFPLIESLEQRIEKLENIPQLQKFGNISDQKLVENAIKRRDSGEWQMDSNC